LRSNRDMDASGENGNTNSKLGRGDGRAYKHIPGTEPEMEKVCY
jgi:hypothetical protein